MPREGVPYPERLLCSLRCELKNIWNALSGKLHSVNGVEGDGQGNLDIVSGDAAVVVTPQPLSNQVEISLDQSQLPAASVVSVNGATGAVVLDGGDIEGVTPGQTVNQEITALTGAISGLGGLISAETTNRQNADSALQTNINTVTASLPAAAAAAVAADPTVASLVTADTFNVKTYGNQSISGAKTFNGNAIFKSRLMSEQGNPFIRLKDTGATRGTIPSSNRNSQVLFNDSQEHSDGFLRFEREAGTMGRNNMQIQVTSNSANYYMNLRLRVNNNGYFEIVVQCYDNANNYLGGTTLFSLQA